jgi:Tetratricopeptide repeat
MAAVAASASARPGGRWLHGPASDLLLGAGLIYLPVFAALALAGGSVQTALPSGLMPILLLATQTPHLGATLLRVYERPESRRRYAFFAVWVTAAITAAFAVGLYQLAVGSVLLTLYLTLTPWHFTGQNYGITLMFLGRRGIAVDPRLKRYIHASFLLSVGLFLLVLHSDRGPVEYAPITAQGTVFSFYSLGIPLPLRDVLLLVGSVAYVWTTGEALVRLLERASLRELLPAFGLMLTQGIWFVLPILAFFFGPLASLDPIRPEQQAYTFLWILATHSVQYLWITSYYVKRERPGTGDAAFLGQALLAGAAVYGLPVLLLAPGVLGRLPYDAGLAVLVGSALSLHHILLDGAIWKLRDGRISRILLAGATAENAEPPRPRRGIRPLIWASGAAGVLLLLLGTSTQFGVERALASGDLSFAERGTRLLARLGRDSAQLRSELGFAKAKGGDVDGALAELRRSVELFPTTAAWLNLGLLLEQRGRSDESLAAFDAAAGLDPHDPRPLHFAGRVALRAGLAERARDYLRRAADLAPDDAEIRALLRQARSGAGAAQTALTR